MRKFCLVSLLSSKRELLSLFANDQVYLELKMHSRSNQKRNRMVVYILAVFLSIFSALIPQEGHTQEVVLQGVVTDRSTGLPIAGVRVRSAVTDASGFYSLTGNQIGSVSGNLLFEADGFFAVQKPFLIEAPLPVTLDADLLPGPGVPLLEGFVRDALTGSPIQGAQLFCSSGLITSNSTRRVSTDSTGFYSYDSSRFFEGAASGFSCGFVSVSAPGFLQKFLGTITVSPPFPGTLDIDLICVSDCITPAPIPPAVSDALADAGIDQSTVPPGVLDALTTAYQQNLLTVVPPDTTAAQDLILQPDEAVVLGTGSIVTGNIQGGADNTVVMGGNSTVQGNILGAGISFIGGSNVEISGNIQDSQSNEVLLGPGAQVDFGGDVKAATLVIEQGGAATIDGDLEVAVKLELGPSTSLTVLGNLICNPGATVSIDPTATLIIGGSNGCV